MSEEELPSVAALRADMTLKNIVKVEGGGKQGKCTVCKETKPLRTGFGRTKRGYRAACSSCVSEAETLLVKDEAWIRKQERKAEEVAQKTARQDYVDKVNDRAKTKKKAAQVAKKKKRAARVLKNKKQVEVTASMQAVNHADRELASRVLARRKLLFFIQKFKPDYEAGWVHIDICNRLERFFKAVENKESPRLILAMPPRHGKSEIASKNFPAWVLGHRPEFEIIASSYNVSLPMGFSRKVKETIQTPLYRGIFPKTALSKTSQAAEAWLTTKGGGYVAAGVGGGITGKGAHVFIIDDPVKDAEEADSETMREKTWDWWGSTAKTRLAPGGGVLVIQCMTGDTPVLRPDGTETRLDLIRVGDEVATWDRGALSSSKVLNHKSNGHDKCFKITMSSGKAVKANGRHPFLVEHTNGKLEWVKVKNLKPTHRIVTLKDNGGNGGVKHVKQKSVNYPSNVGGFVHLITTKLSGLAAINPPVQQKTPNPELAQSLNAGTALLSKIIKKYSKSKKVLVRYAKTLLKSVVIPNTGMRFFALITTTQREVLGGCYVTTATQCLNTAQHPKSFKTQSIISIEPIGKFEVFDMQVEGTENFIANGLVSHNTRWHDDDLSGRMIMQMKEQKEELNGLLEEAQERLSAAANNEPTKSNIQTEIDNYNMELGAIDNWEVVSYPAVATDDEYEHIKTHAIVQGKNIVEIDDSYRRLRKKGEPLHDARFPAARLINMKRSMQPRHWSALYQQNPVPDEGVYFRKEMFRMEPYVAVGHKYNIYIAWDLAIGEKQTNDYTVGAVIGVDYLDQVHVLDIIRGRWDAMGIVDVILDTATRYKPQVIGVERGHLEMAIKPILDKEMKRRGEYFTFASGADALVPINDKSVRARPLQARMQQGMVFFPSNQPWVEQAMFELMRFPGGVHDDIVDALAWAIRVSMKHPPPRAPTQKKQNSWKDKLKAHIVGYNEKTPMAS